MYKHIEASDVFTTASRLFQHYFINEKTAEYTVVIHEVEMKETDTPHMLEHCLKTDTPLYTLTLNDEFDVVSEESQRLTEEELQYIREHYISESFVADVKDCLEYCIATKDNLIAEFEHNHGVCTFWSDIEELHCHDSVIVSF